MTTTTSARERIIITEFEHHGFTGTRDGMTPKQWWALDELVAGLGRGVIHHGCCKGADEQAHALAKKHGMTRAGHPPIHKLHMMNLKDDPCELMYLDEHYLDRNRVIVDLTSGLIAVSKTFREISYGGTWYTIRYARSIGRPITILFPDGTIQKEHGSRVRVTFGSDHEPVQTDI